MPALMAVFADPKAAGRTERAFRTLVCAGDYDDRASGVLVDAINTDRPRLLPVAVQLAAALGVHRRIDDALAAVVR